MNKQDVINNMQTLVDGSSKKDCEKYLTAFLQTLETAVKNRDEVKLAGHFGMKVVERAERSGVNPQTKEKIVIPAKTAIKTTIYKTLKELAL